MLIISAPVLTGVSRPASSRFPTIKRHSQTCSAASDVAVARHAQYQLWGQGIYSAALPERQSGGSLKAHSDRVSFDWEGDALELLNELARLRGQQFSYSGVRLPLPVSLHVRDMTFADVLRITEAQTAWRATLSQSAGRLHLSFMTPEKK
ncbi:DotD/TraH family lipoprotein [Escherichia coli]|nr:DotD/TraH family lipoprotein [Escherichia coli]